MRPLLRVPAAGRRVRWRLYRWLRPRDEWQRQPGRGSK